MTGDPFDSADPAHREAVADIVTIKAMLMSNRPLEALRIAHDAEERHKEMIESEYDV